jgi:hypothetical protein
MIRAGNQSLHLAVRQAGLGEVISFIERKGMLQGG